MKQLLTRLSNVEKKLLPVKPSYPVVVTIWAKQSSLDSEIIYETTEGEALQKHLALHPEHEGRDFEFLTLVAVGEARGEVVIVDALGRSTNVQ